jgi:hypothetical protein
MVDVTTNCHRTTARTQRYCVTSGVLFRYRKLPLHDSKDARYCVISGVLFRHIKIATARPMLLLAPESFSATFRFVLYPANGRYISMTLYFHYPYFAYLWVHSVT